MRRLIIPILLLAAAHPLAAAYAEVGRFSDAIEITNLTLSVARQTNNPRLIARREQRLALYQGGNPFRDQPTK